MVSKNEIKLITSLAKKKYRNKHQLFVAEGVKIVDELLHSNFKIHKIYATDEFSNTINSPYLTNVTQIELQKLSHLTNPQIVVGVFKIPQQKRVIKEGLQVVLDSIQDPGNLGTIIRLCDWFGVSHLVCSNDTVDCFNPKVVQATMGSLARVNISYVDIETYLKKNKLPKYVTMLEGDNLYKQTFPNDAIIIMGNEANGVNVNIQKLADYKLTIPKFGKVLKVESLNVAMATAILLSEFKR